VAHAIPEVGITPLTIPIDWLAGLRWHREITRHGWLLVIGLIRSSAMHKMV
jgi:hypothetical protein